MGGGTLGMPGSGLLALFGFFLVAMQFLQLILGYSPLKAAVGLMPQMLLMIPLSAVAAQVSMRVGQRRLTTLGLLIGAAGMVWFVTVDANSSYWQFLVGMLILSVGIGLSMTPATTAIVSSLPLAKQGVASAVNDTTREVGGALGVAVLGSAFNTAYRNGITDRLGGLDAATAERAREAPAIALDTARRLGGSDGLDLTAVAHQAFESGMRAAVLISAALLLVGALDTWWRAPTAGRAATADTDVRSVRAEDRALEPAVSGGR